MSRANRWVVVILFLFANLGWIGYSSYQKSTRVYSDTCQLKPPGPGTRGNVCILTDRGWYEEEQ